MAEENKVRRGEVRQLRQRAGVVRFEQGFRDEDKIKKPPLRRLCRKAGILRVANTLYPEIRDHVAYDFVRLLLQKASIYAEHARGIEAEKNGLNALIRPLDVIYALKKMNRPFYGGT